MTDTLFQGELQGVCRTWAAVINTIGDREGRIAFFEVELPALLAHRALFEGVLKGILSGSPYPDLRQETLIGNELILYSDPGRMFSLRLYIFGPGEHTFVHDHTAWGVLGSAFGKLEVVRYHREDDGSDPDQAQLALSKRLVLWPGEIETTLPLDQGINTVSMTWITPLLAITSVALTLASLTVTPPLSALMLTSLPLTVAADFNFTTCARVTVSMAILHCVVFLT